LSSFSETGSLPAGLTFTDNADNTATIAGTPATGGTGTYTVVVHASNGLGAQATESVTVVINNGHLARR